jgi:hypothetical protein
LSNVGSFVARHLDGHPKFSMLSMKVSNLDGVETTLGLGRK